jgi:hypothetical protein
MRGKFEDELYGNLYFGKEINIDEKNAIIARNIPMDSVNFDWNEFAKKNKKLMRFYRRADVFISHISNILFVIGFAVSLLALFIAPEPYNILIFILYIVLSILRFFGIKNKSFGILEDASGNPLSFAIVRALLPDSNQEIAHAVSDRFGRYFVLLRKGTYYLKIDKKNEDESYTNVYTSPVFENKKGIVNSNVRIG